MGRGQMAEEGCKDNVGGSVIECRVPLLLRASWWWWVHA